MKAGWWDTPIALWELAEAIPITSDNGLPLLSENNFQPPPFPFPFHLDPPSFYWYLGYLSDFPSHFYLDPPLLFGTGE